MATYQNDDDQFGSLMSKALSPLAAAGIDPDEARANPQAALDKVAQANGYAASPYVRPTFGGQPALQAQATPPPTVAAPAPSGGATPASVTPSGNAKQKTWADYARSAIEGQQRNLQASETANSGIANEPSLEQTTAPIEAQRAAAATPINPQAPQYKPGIGTRILRGIGAVQRGGVLGALDPAGVGATPYGAPNRQYGIDVNQQQQKVGGLDQQLTEAAANYKAASDRAKALASEQRATATGYKDMGDVASKQETAESKSDAQDNMMTKAGFKQVTDAQGNKSWAEDPDSESFKGRKAMDDLRDANAELAQARTAATNADPSTPAGRLAIQKANTAAANAGAAGERAKAYMGRYLQGAYNTGLGGETLPGAPIISNEAGAPTVVGSTNASTAIKNQANTAQFKDVLGATDQLENTATKLVEKQGKGALADPVIAAGIAEPKGTFSQWVQGQVANGSMTPEQRDYVTNLRAYHENLQALRKSAGGGVSDSQVDRLMQMAPGANTPDLDFLKRQTGQIRQTANRLGQGTTQAAGGLTLEKGGNKGGSSGVVYARDQQGHLHSAPAGTALPDGWKQEKR